MRHRTIASVKPLTPLELAGTDTQAFDDALEELAKVVNHHLTEEELTILNPARDEVDLEVRERLGKDFAEERNGQIEADCGRIDAVTMDMMLPVMSGLAATEYIMAHCPTPILIVSAIHLPIRWRFVREATAGAKFIDSLKLFSHVANLGDARSHLGARATGNDHSPSLGAMPLPTQRKPPDATGACNSI